MNFDDLLKNAPYSLTKEQKAKMLTERLIELTEYHKGRCPEYQRMLMGMSYNKSKVSSYKDLPFLPVRLFKDLSLKSVDDDGVVKTMTSSGTSGQSVSKIYLDKATSANQQKTMVKIVNEFTGTSRMPMIIVDCPSVVKDRRMFSARGAGILGFSIFGSKKVYALNDDMQLDVAGLKEFLDKYKGEKILLFGFTFMVWQYFYKELVRLKAEGIEFDLSNGILIHGGGWKKLISEAVSPSEFHDRLKTVCGLDRIHDYYGMVEQTGCIYMQCECGHLHASIFSDVIARNPKDFSECAYGEKGILQVVSTIPESYPGHSLLTEDEGIILGEDDCPCGRKGKYFSILGRIKNAEIRGCSDTFAANIDMLNKKQEDDSDESAILNKITFLIGNKDIVLNMCDVATKQPFDEEVVAFLNDISKELMRDKDAKSFPDIVTLGFWLRKASISSLKERFCANDAFRVGRGVAFHIAPSNVPVNYAYSLFTGLICGNANITRVPTKDFPQIGIINRAINKVLQEHPKMKNYICLVRYDRNKAVNDYLSDICDTRIIWGGDKTIEEIRKSPISARSTDITFADRYSLAVIDSEEYLAVADKERFAVDFYNDTYLSDQNACTSPRVIVWMGSNINRAKEEFWTNLKNLVDEKYELQAVQAVDKLTNAYEAYASGISKLTKVSDDNNAIVRLSTDLLQNDLMDYRCHSGFFYEYDCTDILEVRDFCDNVHCQTVGVVGDTSIVESLLKSGIKGIDRVVKIGHTMDFDLIWDGYNLVERLTRTIGM